MMYLLNGSTCHLCKGDLEILGCSERDERTHKKVLLVSHAVCLRCGSAEVMPPEDYVTFVRKYCRAVND